jgi:NAD(P)-dependent dehydrogenase (short-subunit alcohol dehydrogenase family)
MSRINLDLTGKVALVTGSGRGIGLAIAQSLASHGCAVAIQDIDIDVAQAEAEKINQLGGKAIAIAGDIADLALPDRCIAEVMRQLGGLHILVNNAAIQLAKNWQEFTYDEITKIVNADFLSPIRFCQLAAEIFKAQRWGRIVNIGSIQQRVGNADMLPYSMSKAALENLTRALARTLAPDQVTVNLLNPGYFNTYRNRFDWKDDQERIDKGKSYVPIGRIGEPEDCAGIAVFLASNAGGYITGQTIYVDGGMSVK